MAIGSFIPDKPVQGGRKTRSIRRIYLLSYAVYIFFAVAVLSTIAMWLYKQYLFSELNNVQMQVQEEQKNFDNEMYTELINFNEKLQQATTVFDSQTDVAVLLDALEEVLLSNVTLTSFSYDNSLGQAVLTLIPEFQSINDALYQREVINRHTLFNQAEIDNIVMDGGEEADATEATVIRYDVTVQIDRATLRDYDTITTVQSAPATSTATTSAVTAEEGSDVIE